MTEKTISGVHVHVSPGSAETLVRGGGITNHHHLVASSLSNISANNYQNRLMYVEVIVCNTSVVFFRYGVQCVPGCGQVSSTVLECREFSEVQRPSIGRG